MQAPARRSLTHPPAFPSTQRATNDANDSNDSKSNDSTRSVDSTEFELGGLLVGLALAGIIQPARAQSGDPMAATELFRLGRDAMAARRYDVACSRFTESQRLDPKVGTLINLALCEEATAKLADALRSWGEAVHLAHQLGDARESYAFDRREEIAPRVPHAVLSLTSSAPPDTRVQLDGSAVPPGDLGAPVAVNAGPHVVVASAPGRAERRYEFAIATGETLQLEVGLAMEVAAPVGPPAAAHRDSAGQALGTREIAGLALAGAGVVTLAVGMGFGALASSAWSNAKALCGGDAGSCKPSGVANASSYQTAAVTDGTVATVTLVAGGATLVSGGVLFFIGRQRVRSGDTTAARFRLEPILSLGSAGISAVGTFE